VWGAALLVFLPNWSNDLSGSFSLSGNVSHNLPLAIYGLVLIGAMLVWPTGIQGGIRRLTALITGRISARRRSQLGAAPEHLEPQPTLPPSADGARDQQLPVPPPADGSG
jgi:hypothetical protein